MRHRFRKPYWMMNSTVGNLVSIFALAFILLVDGPITSSANGQDCSITTGFIPINDLGSATYQGFQGGLYPGGSNLIPIAHRQLGEAIAATIQPLDQQGNPTTNGFIAFVSIGVSNTRNEFSGQSSDGGAVVYDMAFKPRADADPAKNPQLILVNGAHGGKAIDEWLAADSLTWDQLDSNLNSVGLSPSQVQVGWVKLPDRGQGLDPATKDFPDDQNDYKAKLGDLVRMAKQRYPNLKLLYFSSRSYGGYRPDKPTSNIEPYAYQSAFGVKWLIEDQINGDPNLDPDPDGDPQTNDGPAPWLAWGAYFWADGANPRSDGLTWLCSDFESDGFHQNNDGAKKVSDLLLDFFKTDATAVPWFLNNDLLPVELVSFTAVVQATDVLLRWVTASESNNFGFDIERKRNKSEFEKIGFVAGNGTSSRQNIYEYGDKSLQPGLYIYRLKQIDTDGSVELLGQVTALVQTPKKFSIEPNYPNPFRNSTNIIFTLPRRTFVTLRIYNVLGQEIRRLVSRELEAGLHQVQWNGLGAQQQLVAHGIYFLTLWRQSPDGVQQLISKRKILFVR